MLANVQIECWVGVRVASTPDRTTVSTSNKISNLTVDAGGGLAKSLSRGSIHAALPMSGALSKDPMGRQSRRASAATPLPSAPVPQARMRGDLRGAPGPGAGRWVERCASFG